MYKFILLTIFYIFKIKPFVQRPIFNIPLHYQLFIMISAISNQIGQVPVIIYSL